MLPPRYPLSLFCLLFLHGIFAPRGPQSSSSPAFPFLVLGPFNQEEMFFSSAVPRARAASQRSIRLNSTQTVSFPSLLLSPATVTRRICWAFSEYLDALINALSLSRCCRLVLLLLLSLLSGPQTAKPVQSGKPPREVKINKHGQLFPYLCVLPACVNGELCPALVSHSVGAILRDL